jgi:ribosomal protein S7
MVQRKNKTLNIRKKLVNIALVSGKKECNEKFYLNFYKSQSKIYHKRPSDSFKAALIAASPIFKSTTKKSGRKSTVSIPSVFNPKSRIFYGIKTILSHEKKSNPKVLTRLHSHISNFSIQLVSDSTIKFENTKKSFEQKTFAHFRWFK